MSGLACFGKLPVERRIVSPRLFPQRLTFLPALPEVLIHDFPIRYIESQSTEDLLKTQGWKGFSDSLGGLSPEKCVDHRVQRNAGVFDEVATIAPLDVFRCHRATSPQYTSTVEHAALVRDLRDKRAGGKDRQRYLRCDNSTRAACGH